MTKRMVLAGLLARAAVPALAVAASQAAPVSTDEARALAAKQIAAQQKADSARTCACPHGH